MTIDKNAEIIREVPSETSSDSKPTAPVIPNDTMLQDIAGVTRGDIKGYPFALLLLAHTRAESSIKLELKRNQMKKVVFFDKGQLVQCESNIQHESFGGFLVERNILEPDQLHECQNEAAAENLRLNEVLLRHQLIAPYDLFKMLQQNLAYKLLDAFGWTCGQFCVHPLATEVINPLSINVPQLILTALNRLDAFDAISTQIRRLAKRPLELNPEVLWTTEELKLNAKQARVMALLKTIHGLRELEEESPLDTEALHRFLYGMAFLGVVVPDSFANPAQKTMESFYIDPNADSQEQCEEETETADPPPQLQPLPVPEAPRPQAEANPCMPDGMVIDTLLRTYSDLGNRDAFELLGVGTHADLKEIREAFIKKACACGPWNFDHPDAQELKEKASDVFVAMARAFVTLENPETRMALLQKRQPPAAPAAVPVTPSPTPQKPAPAPPAAKPKMNQSTRKPSGRAAPAKQSARDAFAIKTDLLDPVKQYRIGVKLMEADRCDEALEFLELAHDIDSTQPRYRSELVYCHFRIKPSLAEKALDEINGIVREHPGCHIAQFHLGELHRHVGNRAAAEKCYKKAMANVKRDDRPAEALRSLGSSKR